MNFDVVEDIHNAAILQIRLVVHEAPRLLRELRDGSLRVLAGVKPIVVNAIETLVWFGFLNCRQLQYLLEETGQFLLSRLRHKKIPERAKASPLIGIGDGITLAEDFIEHGFL